MKLKKYLKAAKSRISGGSEYCWDCYGPNARFIDVCNRNGDDVGGCVYDHKTMRVYEITVVEDEYPVIWRDHRYSEAHADEAALRGVDENQAWDDVSYDFVSEEHILVAASLAADSLTDSKEGMPDDYDSRNYDSAYCCADDSDYQDALNSCNDNMSCCGRCNNEQDLDSFDLKEKDSVKSYTVVVLIKSTLDIIADTMQEASKTGERWINERKDYRTRPDNLSWLDEEICSITVSEQLNHA